MIIGISNKYAKICLQKWTSDSQIIKFIEESSELNQKLAKYLLYKDNPDWKGVDYDLVNHIQDEIADVIIVLGTLIEIFDTPNIIDSNSKISKRIKFKLLRLMDRLKQ